VRNSSEKILFVGNFTNARNNFFLVFFFPHGIFGGKEIKSLSCLLKDEKMLISRTKYFQNFGT
jgi:hypothetical protein